jgi:hypothetical protein
VVPEIDGDEGKPVILVSDDGEAVRQGVLLEFDDRQFVRALRGSHGDGKNRKYREREKAQTAANGNAHGDSP